MQPARFFASTALLLAACANQLPASSFEVAPLEARPLGAREGDRACAITSLEAAYLDDVGDERGRIAVRWDGERAGEGTVEVEVHGAPPVLARVASGQSDLLSEARIQEALDIAEIGGVQVRVRVERDCGASADRIFVFEDPIARCATPRLDAIDDEAVFYACAERWVAEGRGCGERGYLLGYGERYARKFYRETRPRMTARGRVWLDRVLVCLQEDLRDAIHLDTSCDDIRRIAFDQHPRCYAESGFCTLPLTDVLKVPATIDGRDLLSKDGLRQLVQIVPECGRVYGKAISTWLGRAPSAG